VPYLSASAVVIHYEEVLYMYAPLPSVCTFSGSGSSGSDSGSGHSSSRCC